MMKCLWKEMTTSCSCVRWRGFECKGQKTEGPALKNTHLAAPANWKIYLSCYSLKFFLHVILYFKVYLMTCPAFPIILLHPVVFVSYPLLSWPHLINISAVHPNQNRGCVGDWHVGMSEVYSNFRQMTNELIN